MEIKEVPKFVNRERGLREFKALLSGRPNLLYFVYGPINSGKTALLMKVFEELPEDYRVFYINFRGRDVERVEDLIRVLFRVKEGEGKISKFIKEILKDGAKFLERVGGIPIPEGVFDLLFRQTDKVEDVFAFLEEYFMEVVDSGYKPVLVFDEMQTIKEVINATGKPVLARLFNFMVRLTKETHLCHSLCATSDCLFIEDVYANARLEGRAEYIFVDDLKKEEAFPVYEEFGFKEKELVWNYIGGKFGDMIKLYERKKRGLSEEEALREMLKDERARLEWMLDLLEEGEKEGPGVNEIKAFLEKFKDQEERRYKEVKGKVLKFLIQENVLFYNPVEATVRPQSRLLHRAIVELMC